MKLNSKTPECIYKMQNFSSILWRFKILILLLNYEIWSIEWYSHMIFKCLKQQNLFYKTEADIQVKNEISFYRTQNPEVV